MSFKESALYRGMRYSFQKKCDLKQWYRHRNQIRNWLGLYVRSSSFLHDLFVRYIRKWEWARRLKIKVSYTNGLTLLYPITTSTHYTTFLGMETHAYFADFERLYNKTITFDDGDIVVDIGAHIGKFSIPLLRENPGVRVYAYEPEPYNVQCLKENIEINGLDSDRFAIEPLAVYDTNTELRFSIGDRSTRGSISDVGFIYRGAQNTEVAVKTTTIADIFAKNNIEKCKILKIDCEGSEYRIFETLDDGMLDNVEYLFIEIHPTIDREPLWLKEHIERRGFVIKGDICTTGCYELFCENRKEKKTDGYQYTDRQNVVSNR